MFFVYLLRSTVARFLYIGYTNNLLARVKQHNNGESSYTKKYIPWKLIYYEAYLSEKDARDREKQLKRFANAYVQLKRRISHSIEG